MSPKDSRINQKLCCVCAVLGIELRASHMLGKGSTPEQKNDFKEVPTVLQPDHVTITVPHDKEGKRNKVFVSLEQPE